MEIEVRMTGREDREGPWKVAIAGYPGAGKTLLASTVHPGENLFIWFPDSPIKSVANRFLPNVRLANVMNPDGTLRTTVQDQLQLIIGNLHAQALSGDLKYKAITVDTGDQLFQQMASARRIKNRGEFGPGDWVWLADAYRSVMQSLIDLPMHVIVLFHLTASQDGQDGFMVRELALQGSSKPDAPGWFDVVAALDTFESVDKDGDAQTQRVLLTHSSRLYPWVKDHSGNMPARFPISAGFVGDWDRLYALFVSDSEFTEGQESQVLETIVDDRKATQSGAAVPSPEELHVKKTEKAAAKQEPADEPIVPEPPAPDLSTVEQDELPLSVPDVPEPIPTPSDTEDVESTDVPEPSNEEIVATLAEGGIDAKFVCDVCGTDVPEDLMEITTYRFNRIMCRPHFSEALKQNRV